MPKYHVINPVKIGDKLHKPGGDPIEVDEKTGKLLEGSKSLKLHVEQKEGEGDPLKKLIKLNAKDVIEALGAAEADELPKLYQLEKDGDVRKTVIEAIEAEIEKRKKPA